MKLDVCIVTHNPRRPVFALVLQSIARQSLSRDAFHIWIIDNASTPPLTEADLGPLRHGGVPHTLVLEPRLGNAYGRAKAIEVTSSEWIVFVDDDNELAENYLEKVLEIARQKPHLGCFGGKLLLPPTYQVEPWIQPLLPYLAIKDCGDEVISNCVEHWGIWEPPTAGAAVRRPVLQLFSERMRLIGDTGRLGRRGKSGLMSCEDGVMMRGACLLGLHCSYEPKLKLYHHIDPARFNFKYLLRLCYYYGRSTVLMDRLLGHEVVAQTAKDAWKLITNFPRGRKKACRLAWQWGHFAESRSQSDMAAVAARLATAKIPLVPPSPTPATTTSPDHPQAASAGFCMEDALAHLVKKGFRPMTVLDAGAYKGYWSRLANHFFPDAQFFLIEPVSANEPPLKELCASKPTFRYHMLAVGDQAGEQVMNVTPELTASSLLPMGTEWQAQGEKVRVVTLDSLLEQGLVQPPQLVKMDLQGYELKALDGGSRLFDSAEVFILEALLYEIMPGAPIFHEIVDYMARRGYVVFDFAGHLHRDFEKDLGQLDVVFVKKSSPLVASIRWS
jgi:FkbM family methyltransferase